jgi:hypothetical protein
MPPKGASTKVAAVRLPPLPKLRVRRPNQIDANPCLTIMSSVLSTPLPNSQHSLPLMWLLISSVACWASSGYNVAGCAALENSLRACMDAPVRDHSQVLFPEVVLIIYVNQRPKNPPKNTINYHLSRMYPALRGPQKRK